MQSRVAPTSTAGFCSAAFTTCSCTLAGGASAARGVVRFCSTHLRERGRRRPTLQEGRLRPTLRTGPRWPAWLAGCRRRSTEAPNQSNCGRPYRSGTRGRAPRRPLKRFEQRRDRRHDRATKRLRTRGRLRGSGSCAWPGLAGASAARGWICARSGTPRSTHTRRLPHFPTSSSSETRS